MKTDHLFYRLFVERVQTEFANDLDRQRAINLIETIALYKLPNFTQEELAQMFAIDDLRQTRFAQEMKAEGSKETKQQVISQLLPRGFSLDEISEIVDLSVEEVRQIVERIQANSER